MPEETFAEKVKRAADKHPRSRKRAAENAETERARYRKPTRRAPTRSD